MVKDVTMPSEVMEEAARRSPYDIIGAFSSLEDSALIDEIMEDIRARREHDAAYCAER